MLATIFKPESLGKFTLVDTDVIRDRKALVFEFSVDRDHAQQVVAATGYTVNSTITGMKGKVWVDREIGRILRVESEATEIPDTFPIRTARRVIDYDWVKIADEKYLLPLVSDVRLTIRDKGPIWESRNVIKFKDYQKYGTEVIIRDDDVKPEPETKKP